jgi:hypothetical protein
LKVCLNFQKTLQSIVLETLVVTAICVLSLFLTGLFGNSLHAAEISVRASQYGGYELELTSLTALSETESKTILLKAAESLCVGTSVVLGRWRYSSNVSIGETNKSSDSGAYRLIQEVSCAAGVAVPATSRTATLKNVEESLSIQKELKLKSQNYFELLSSKQAEKAMTYIAITGMGVSEAKWKSDKQSFYANAGEQIQIAIVKMTVYDNPVNAPEPGLYIAADYSNSYSKTPFHCGYLMWFRPIGGEFQITREESGHMTSEQFKSIPKDKLPAIKRGLRCVEPSQSH